MEPRFIFLLLLGAAVGLWLPWLVRRYRAAPPPDQPAATDAATDAEPPPSEPEEFALPPPEPAPGALTARLHALEAAFAPFGNSSAHPRELADHPAFKQAVELLADMAVPRDIVMQYAFGANWGLSCAALAALNARLDSYLLLDQVVAAFDKLAPWPMHFALEYFLSAQPRPPVGAVVAGAKDWWRENPFLPLLIQDYFARRQGLGDPAEFGSSLIAVWASPHAVIRAFLERVNHDFARTLVAAIDDLARGSIDRDFLATFGRFWSDRTEPSTLIEPQDWHTALANVEAAMAQSGTMRPLLVSGEPLTGKTSFLRLLARNVAGAGWTVFEAGGADLMAGQQWFGQLEGRIREAVQQLTVAKKLIWYIPDLLALARSGTHQGQSASILDQILPAVVAGRLLVWTEATPASVAHLLQMRPALRSIFSVVRIEPQSEEETLVLARALIGRLSEPGGIGIDPQCAEVAVASARQYLSASFPGAVLQLLKLTIASADKEKAIAPRDVLATLAELSGLPLSILDNRERIDLASIRAFFASRVIGQDEAVASVVERIAMLKSGLNDPDRPVGVFLFAGPTGTGKTELAKTTAEFLFGSVERLIRLDMSEFQTADSVSAILGTGAPGETTSLIHSVRKQPFSVVLLDEFEKAHPRIWDLFLQVFDDARLTDTLGQVADFRHCLIIMTTNLGATSHQTSGLGFAPVSDVFTGDQVMKAIAQTYRPEFQNRIDKIIVFRPLSRDLMRIILRKELDALIERRGLRNRAWAVEWESSALEFLLEKGFSPEMGARPLKRAIEQYVIAPLAAAIVEHRLPEGEQFVFVRSNGRAIRAEFVDPDAEPAAAATGMEDAAAPASLPAMILAPSGSAAELEALVAGCKHVERLLASSDWEERKRWLADAMSAPGFWETPERFETLSRLALIDRVAAAAATTEALRGRLLRGPRERHSRELVSRLALQLHLAEQGIRDAAEGAPIEVAVMVEPALKPAAGDGQASEAWCRSLLDMYRGWSSNRHMQIEELPGAAGALPILLVSGFGAHRVLSRESGLHVLESTDQGEGANRVTARVRLTVPPLGEFAPARMQRALGDAFAAAPASSTVVRRYRSEPSPLVRSADGSRRTGRLDAVLRGDFDLLLCSPD